MAGRSSGWCNVGFQLLYTSIILALLTGVQARGKICTRASKCINTEYNQAVRDKDFDALCIIFVKVFECFDKAEQECGDLGMAFNNVRDRMMETHKAKCKGKSDVVDKPDVEEPDTSSGGYDCIKNLQNCLDPDLRRAQQEKDDEALCRVGPKSFECMERVNARCGYGKDAEAQFISDLKKEVMATCNNNSAAFLHCSPMLGLLCLLLLLHNLTRGAF